MNFDDFKSQVEKIRSNQANYQPITICFLANSKNQENTQRAIAERLAVKNGKSKADYKPFMGSCPVYKVLLAKDLLVRKGDVFKLNIAIMTPAQKKQISKLCMEMLN